MVVCDPNVLVLNIWYSYECENYNYSNTEIPCLKVGCLNYLIKVLKNGEYGQN